MLSIRHKKTNEKNGELKVFNTTGEKMGAISLPLDFKAQFAKLRRKKKKNPAFGVAQKTSATLLTE